MAALLFVVVAIAVAVLMVAVGDRLNLPWPALMVLIGAGAAVLPGVPTISIDPELILPLFLPPLLFATAQRTSWSLFLARWRSILGLAIALTVATIAAVAGTAAALVPGLGITAALAVAAAVAPPDPVAVEAVSGSLRLPQRMLSVLRSEGLFNDAVSLVVFQTALSALDDGGSIGVRVTVEFCYGIAAAAAIGFGFAWVARLVRPFITDAAGRTALDLALPFAVYLVADQVLASGVIAVVVAALQLRQDQDSNDVEDRLTGDAFWQVVELAVTGAAFGLVGLQLRAAVVAAGSDLPRMLAHAAVVCVVIFSVRTAWMLMAAPQIRRRDEESAPRTRAEAVVMTWAGMRGLVTLALALALPTTVGGEPFAARTELVVIAGSVIVVTLLLPGFTLGLLVRALGLTVSEQAEQEAERPLIERARRAATTAVQDPALVDPDDAAAAEQVLRVLSRLDQQLGDDEDERDRDARLTEQRQRREAFTHVQSVALGAARAEIVLARRQPGTDPEAADRVLRRLDRRSTGG